MQLMASLPCLLEKQENLESAFEIFSDSKAADTSSDEDNDSDDSE
jgi:hypothetical protein